MKIPKAFTLSVFLLINVIVLSAQQKVKKPESPRVTYISGEINPGLKQDTLTLVLHGPFYHYGQAPESGAAEILETTADQQGRFKFKVLSGNSPFHVSLFLSRKKKGHNRFISGAPDINDYLIGAGDSIHIVFDKGKQYFSGKGADLFNVQYKIEGTDKGNMILTHDENDYFRKDPEKWLKKRDSLLNVQLGLLAADRPKLTPVSYGIVRADVIGVNRAWVYRRINFAGPFFVAGTPLKQDLADLCKELERRPAYNLPADRSSLSPGYIYYLYSKIQTEVKFERIVNQVNVFLDENYFPAINKQYTGIVRDKLLVYWLTQITAFNDLQPEYLEAALAVMQTPAFADMVIDLQKTFVKGRPVLDYGFKDPAGKTVHLADFKGKVLLIDLWFSGCGGCIDVAAGLPDVEAAFKGRKDLAFVSISIDRDKQMWLRSIDKNPSGTHYKHYTTESTIYLYTGGTANDNPFIKTYVPTNSYPELLIVDQAGKIFSSTPSRPVTEQGKADLIKEIGQAFNAK